jgi:hypothetical protein
MNIAAWGFLLALAQEDLTVLSPEDRPRKMLNTYLVAQNEKHFALRRDALAALKTTGRSFCGPGSSSRWAASPSARRSTPGSRARCGATDTASKR